MDEFVCFSNACLNRVVDHIGSLDKKTDIRRYTDVYQHLLKIQRDVLESECAPDREDRFRKEWATCEPTLNGSADEQDPADPGEQPTPEQLEEFKKTVAAWFQVDDEERELKRRAGERRMLKGRLTAIVLSFMQRFEIEDLDTRDGKLRFFKREVSRAPNKDLQMKRIIDFFGEEKQDVAESLKSALFQKQRVESLGIRRLKPSTHRV